MAHRTPGCAAALVWHGVWVERAVGAGSETAAGLSVLLPQEGGAGTILCDNLLGSLLRVTQGAEAGLGTDVSVGIGILDFGLRLLVLRRTRDQVGEPGIPR